MKKRIPSFAIYESKEIAADIVKKIQNTKEGKDLLALPIILKPVNTGRVWIETRFPLAKEAITVDGNEYTHSTYSNGAVYASQTYDNIEETLRSFWISIIRRASVLGVTRKELESWASDPKCPAWNKEYNYEEVLKMVPRKENYIEDPKEYFKTPYWEKLANGLELDFVKSKYGNDEIFGDAKSSWNRLDLEKMRSKVGYTKTLDYFGNLDTMLVIDIAARGTKKGLKTGINYNGLEINIVDVNVEKGSEKIRKALIKHIDNTKDFSKGYINEKYLIAYKKFLMDALEEKEIKETNYDFLKKIKIEILLSTNEGIELLLSSLDLSMFKDFSFKEIIQDMIDESPTKAAITLKAAWGHPKLKEIRKDLKVPDNFLEDIGLLGDLHQLGL